MKTNTKRLSLLLAFVMIMSVLVFPSTAITQSPSDMFDTLSKTASQTSDEFADRMATITFDIQAKAQEEVSGKPSDVILVLDVSTSMNGTKLTNMKNAAKDFVDALLPDGTSQNKVALVTYAQKVYSDDYVALTSDADALKDTIDDLGTHSWTNMHGGMLMANQILKGLTNPGRASYVVFLSDGEPNRSFNLTPSDTFDINNQPSPSSNHTATRFSTAAGAVKEKATVYTVFLGNDDDAEELMADAATSGEVLVTNDSSDLSALFDSISSEIISTIATGSVLTDTIPPEFMLVKANAEDSGYFDRDGSFDDENVDVVENDAGTTITWTLGDLGSTPVKLSYVIQAKTYGYGILDTNTEALLAMDTLYHFEEPQQVSFANQYAFIRPYAFDETRTGLIVGQSYDLLAMLAQNHANNDRPGTFALGDLEIVDILQAPGFSGTLEPNGSDGLTYTPSTAGTDVFTYKVFAEVSPATAEAALMEIPYELYSDVATVTLTAATPEPEPEPDPDPSPRPTPRPSPTTKVALDVTVVGPGTVLPGSGSYSQGSLVAFTITPDPGAVFLGFTGTNGSEVNADDQLLMNADKSVTATFEIPAAPLPTPTPVVQEILPTPVPEAAPVLTPVEEPVTEETVPLAAPELPKTAGLPLALLMGFGALMTATGIAGKKRK